MDSSQSHQMKIQDQFTKQAIPFTNLPGHLSSMEVLVAMSGVKPNETVLDVACGPGLVACEFAKHAKQVTGIDITEKMILEASKKQAKEKINNVKWDIGNVTSLPYAENSFNIVLTRYSFHHFIEPKIVFNEMIRVCKPNGKIMVIDVSIPEDKNEFYDQMEKLRDPSHTKALTPKLFEELFNDIRLINQEKSIYSVDMELEAQLKASFPNPGDDEKLRAIFKNDIGVDNLGVNAHFINNEIHFSYPISIYIAMKSDK